MSIRQEHYWREPCNCTLYEQLGTLCHVLCITYITYTFCSLYNCLSRAFRITESHVTRTLVSKNLKENVFDSSSTIHGEIL